MDSSTMAHASNFAIAEDQTSCQRSHPTTPAFQTHSDSSDTFAAELLIRPNAVTPTISRSFLWILGYTLRTLFCDIPLLVVLLTYFSLNWIHHVHDNYLYPQMQALVWDEERATQDITYYTRFCDADDMTTKNGADLFLPRDASPKEAYEHQLLHGFTIFKSVLTTPTARDLRSFVSSRNRNLTSMESIFVIEGNNRFSFGLGTEEPSVAKAMKELANHDQLRRSLEKIIGPNPALIEMTAITSSYGAVAQWWHDDVIPTASAVKYARTFAPSYSVFVQLQNTTKQMGATSACPGSHYCGAGRMDLFCDEEGFQVVGDDGYWGIGDALLMNMNSYHRGAAHTDPEGEDRVMLILTFAPKPESRVESRQMSEGITFSLRWDMWGHTLYDLARADTRMTQPWATLRALGLYKPDESDWGTDYISSTSMRLLNDYNGFIPDDLASFIEAGGFPLLPSFLQAEFNEDHGPQDAWYHFILETFFICKEFMKRVSIAAIVGYVAFFLLVASWSGKKNRAAKFFDAILRLLLILGVVYLAEILARRHVDESLWAIDIKANRRYSSVFTNELHYDVVAKGSSTFPTRHDVLIENRYGSEYLAMYDDYINGHPGNRVFGKAVRKAAPYFSSYSDLFKKATIGFVVETIEMELGRFLLQGPKGNWYLMEREEALDYTAKEIAALSSPGTKAVRDRIRLLKGDCRFGVYRDTAMSKSHNFPYLKSLEDLVLACGRRLVQRNPLLPLGVNANRERVFFGQSRMLQPPVTRAQFKRRGVDLGVGSNPEPPSELAWLKSGDFVEGVVDGYWYVGELSLITAHGLYHIDYPDGDSNYVDEYEIRSVLPLDVGEKAEYFLSSEGIYVPSTVTAVLNDFLYNIIIDETGKSVEEAVIEHFRRPLQVEAERYEYQAAY
jgi:hypothetical protein